MGKRSLHNSCISKNTVLPSCNKQIDYFHNSLEYSGFLDDHVSTHCGCISPISESVYDGHVTSKKIRTDTDIVKRLNNASTLGQSSNIPRDSLLNVFRSGKNDTMITNITANRNQENDYKLPANKSTSYQKTSEICRKESKLTTNTKYQSHVFLKPNNDLVVPSRKCKNDSVKLSMDSSRKNKHIAFRNNEEYNEKSSVSRKKDKNEFKSKNSFITRDGFQTICLTPPKTNITLKDSSLLNSSSAHVELFTPENKNRACEDKRISETVQKIIKDLCKYNLSSSNNYELRSKYSQDETDGECSELFKGLTFYVDVWIEGNKVSSAVEHKLQQMGGKIVHTMKSNVTHLVFKEGSATAHARALKEGIPIVSATWIEACKLHKAIVDEHLYPATDIINLIIKKKTQYDEETIVEKVVTEENQQTAMKKLNGTEKRSSTKRQVKSISSSIESEDHISIDLHVIKDRKRSSNASENSCKIVAKKNRKTVVNKSVKRKQSKTKTGNAKNVISNHNNCSIQVLNSTCQKGKTSQKMLKENAMEMKTKNIITNSESKGKGRLNYKSKADRSHKENTIQPNSMFSTLESMRRKPLEASKENTDSTLCVSNVCSLFRPSTSVSSMQLGLRTLVTTSLSLEFEGLVNRAVRKLGNFSVVGSVQGNTTHVICGRNRRTMNILLGIAQRCWILSVDWVLESEKKGYWLPEKQYEVNYFSSARKSDKKIGLAMKSLFLPFGCFYISLANPFKEEVIKLIQLCGGQTSNNLNDCKVVVGLLNKPHNYEGIMVTEKWIFDCITEGRILSYY